MHGVPVRAADTAGECVDDAGLPDARDSDLGERAGKHGVERYAERGLDFSGQCGNGKGSALESIAIVENPS